MLDIDPDFAYHWRAVAKWLAAVVVIAACAAALPARVAGRINVREALV